ncbi:MAG: hypothetical protein K0Q64_2036 [Nitrobacter vulgaris]|nr:hypothetical protein [Nitrobacter vulgaris]
MDAITFWSDVALELNKKDHSKASEVREQQGPCFSSRALAITFTAFHDAFKAGCKLPRRYLFRGSAHVGSPAIGRTAGGRAAYICLLRLYPSEASFLEGVYTAFVSGLWVMEGGPTDAEFEQGIALGNSVADTILCARSEDGSATANPGDHTSTTLPGAHIPDPLHPDQGFYGVRWGTVTPFVLSSSNVVEFRPPPPPALLDPNYRELLNEVRSRGDRKVRSYDNEDTLIGLFWAYDGARNLGTPPRLYNQILMAFAEHEHYREVDKVELFAMANLAMADAAIVAWDAKYYYNFWRPVAGIRNDPVDPDRHWEPQGAPNTNSPERDDFTPNFPSYPSGHATFGGACFTVLRHFRSSLPELTPWDIELSSEELETGTIDADGTHRPCHTRSFADIEAMITENARSRIFLGVHWDFDGTAGVDAGKRIGDMVFDNALT